MWTSKAKLASFFFFQCFLFSPQLVDKTITKVIVLVCVCKSSQLLPAHKVDKRFIRFCLIYIANYIQYVPYDFLNCTVNDMVTVSVKKSYHYCSKIYLIRCNNICYPIESALYRFHRWQKKIELEIRIRGLTLYIYYGSFHVLQLTYHFVYQFYSRTMVLVQSSFHTT